MQHKPITDKWLLKEIQFHQRHEEILMRREALLRGTETFYDVQAHQAASFISDATKARDRNEQLLKDFHQFQTDFEHAIATPETPKFQTLRNNYWAMVKNVFPVWQEELKEFYRRQNMKTSPNSSRRQKSPSHKGQRSATLPRSVSARARTPSPRRVTILDQPRAHTSRDYNLPFRRSTSLNRNLSKSY